MPRPLVWLAISVIAGCALERKSVQYTPLDHCSVVECEGPWSWDALPRGHGNSSTGGGISRSAGHSQVPVVIRDAAGHPVVAWQEGSQIYVHRWDDSDWVALEPTVGEYPAMVLHNGILVVAYLRARSAPDNDWLICAQQWTGDAWTPLVGGNVVVRTTTGGLTPHPALASGSDLFLAWTGYENLAYQIYLLAWNGAAWIELDGSATGGGISQSPTSGYRPDVAVNATGEPTVVWEEYRDSENAGVFLRAYEEEEWVGISGSTDGHGIIADVDDTNTRHPSVVYGPTGPVVAWQIGRYAAGVAVAQPNGATWDIMGASPISLGTGYGATPTLGLTDNIVLAWSDSPTETAPAQIHVATWSGGTWLEMGSGSARLTNDLGDARAPSLFAPGGAPPLLVWQDDSTGLDLSNSFPPTEIFLEEYVGSVWQPFGSETAYTMLSESGDGTALAPTLTMTSAGPVVAWHRETLDGSAAIHALTHDGTVWIPLGATSQVSAADASGNRYPCLASDGDTPTLAWTHDDGAGRADIYVARWNGSGWQGLDGSASGFGVSGDGNGDADLPAVALVDGEPVVAWQGSDGTDEFQIYLARWSGVEWQSLDGSATAGGVSNMDGGSFAPALATTTQSIVVAWTRDTDPDPDGYGPYEIYVRRWHNEQWGELDGSASNFGISGTFNNSLFPAVAIADNGEPVVAWTEQAGGRFTYVVRWNDSEGSWNELGNDSASDVGIGGVVGENLAATVGAHAPAISIDERGHTWVAWTDASSGIYEIYARRWDGDRWESVDGSANTGGISNSSAPSLHPALDADDQHVCATWVQGVGRGTEIGVRCASENR